MILFWPERGKLEGGLEQVFARYREGSTIVLQFVHQYWKPLADLSTTLSVELSAGCQVNAYLTPRNSRGLGVHYDTHDVFVVQVEGSKHWRLFESPVTLPLPGQPYRSDKLASSTQLYEFDLHTGDLLYIPRGFVHEAIAKDSTSLHLTVGILPVTWAEVVLAAVESVVESNPEFRESLPPGFAREEAVRREAEARLIGLLDRLLSEISPRAAVLDAIDRAWLATRPNLEGHLLDLDAELSVDLNTHVRRRPGVLWRLSRVGEELYVHFHGKRLRMPSHVQSDLEFIAETDEPFTGASLPGRLDQEGRLVLIRRLIHEGFLTAILPLMSGGPE